MQAPDERLVDAARAGDEAAFRAVAEPFRRELLGHLYRMSGSLHEAEDLLQETMLRAWRGIARFEGRASVRTWLHRIASNVALDELSAPRVLPSDRGAANDPTMAGSPPLLEEPWLEPFPDSASEDAVPPDARYSARESIALAFVHALQRLPGRQRVVLLARDVLGFSAEETAEIVDASVPATNALLQRARETLDAPGERATPRPPQAPAEVLRALLDRYVRAWDAGDARALVAILKDDARLTMPPIPYWLSGAGAIVDGLRAMVLLPGAPPRFRLQPVAANGSPAFAAWERDASGAWRAQSIHVLRLEGDRIAEITAFIDPSLFPAFSIPAVLPG